jgi:hypothetical protein
MEDAGPAIAQKHLVYDGRAVPWVPHYPAFENSVRRRNVPLLAQRRGKGVNRRHVDFPLNKYAKPMVEIELYEHT